MAMAIDFMVMPLSRYLSGDFITPGMRACWAEDVPYFIVGPEGKRDLPSGAPFGGADAGKNRERIIDMVLEDLRALPQEISGSLWDERSTQEPRFHRVDPTSYQALLDHFEARRGRSFLGFRRRGEDAHCTSLLCLPCDFQTRVALRSPLERVAGATVRALEELARGGWATPAASAADTLRAALEDSRELRLPLIVDW